MKLKKPRDHLLLQFLYQCRPSVDNAHAGNIGSNGLPSRDDQPFRLKPMSPIP
jgi:hypothetical protein